MKNTVEEDDDVAVDEAMPFDVVLSNKTAIWSDMLAGHKGKHYRFGPEAVAKT